MMATVAVLRRDPTTFEVFCQHCGQNIILPMAQLQSSGNLLTVPCTCSHVMRLVRERRKFERLTVQMSGVLLDQTTHMPLIEVNLLDLSLGGVRFVASHHDIRVEDLFTLRFHLDDACSTMIQEDIVVRSVTERQHIGGEFLYQDGYNFELDFYLTPYVVLI